MSFSEIEVPIIRKAIEDKANWFSEETYKEQTDVQEMEQYLKRFVKQELAQHIRKRLQEENFKLQGKISGWRFIRIILLYSLEN
jgi:Skp family chaperone for outer membrane proteins